MSKDNIWFPFYINDWFGDTQHFDAAQHGLYLLLVSEYWKARGPIKLNLERLHKKSKLSKRTFNSQYPDVIELFIIEDGYLRHKRIDKELSKLLSLKEKRSKGGKASAAKRREKQENGNSTHVQHMYQESCTTLSGNACDSDSDCPLRVTTNLTTTPKGDTPETEPPELTLVTADSEGW